MKYFESFFFSVYFNLLLVNVMCNFVVVVVTALNGSGNGLPFLEQILLGVK